jgi:hypothetical protein
MVTVVSGLPRSGTSLMMQMLEAGGMPVLTDGVRQADASNPRGYYELEAVKRTRQDPSWVREAEGKAVKLVYALLPDLPPAEYRVILMKREMREVIASQQKMLERLARQGAQMGPDRLAAIFTREMEKTREWLAGKPGFSWIEVDYAACIASPGEAAARVNAFLGGVVDEPRMAAVVEPSMRHHLTT